MMIFLFPATVFLCILSVSDLRTRTIPGWAPLLFGTVMAFLHLLLSDLTPAQFFAGLIPGAALLLLSLLYRSSLGCGDGFVVLACGAAIGLEREFAALTAGLVFCAVFCIFLLILKRASRSDCLPFLPFLAASHLVMLTAEVIL